MDIGPPATNNMSVSEIQGRLRRTLRYDWMGQFELMKLSRARNIMYAIVSR
jgi:hypothetical protein